MDCICLKKKHRKKHEHNNFRPISAHTSPNHSQPSSLGQNGRLPKVNSTGLWMGAPSMYTTAAPSPAYFYGQGKIPPNKQGMPHHGLVHRASSETRIPSSVPVGLPPQQQPRIFHSSQPLAPVMEMPVARSNGSGMNIYDFYQFGNGGQSRSKLVETKHSKILYRDVTRPSSGLPRSSSDVQDKYHILSKSRGPAARQAPNIGRSTSSSKDIRIVAGNPVRSGRKSHSTASLDGSHASGHFNKAFDGGSSSHGSMLNGEVILRPASSRQEVTSVHHSSPRPAAVPTILNGAEIPQSATDSMKLLAKNKTDDQKTVVSPTNVILSANDDDIGVEDKGLNDSLVKYIYQGDLSTVPDNNKNDDNPILSRMKDMVIEKTRSSSQKGNKNNFLDNSISSLNNEESKQNSQSDPVADILAKTDASIDMKSPASNRGIPSAVDQPDGVVMAATSPKPADDVSTHGASDLVDATEDIDHAGKRITDSAFEFLDTYLSDDDGEGPVDSPPISP